MQIVRCEVTVHKLSFPFFGSVFVLNNSGNVTVLLSFLKPGGIFAGGNLESFLEILAEKTDR